MQTNENHPNRKRIRNFFREKGYYIVLLLCILAVGISGYIFVLGDFRAGGDGKGLLVQRLLFRNGTGHKNVARDSYC